MNDGTAPLLALLHLCDSLFPIGAFAHSDGLEAAAGTGSMATSVDLGRWMEACLDETFVRAEGPVLRLAWEAFGERRWSELRDLDADVRALRPSSTARQASCAMGARLLKTWQHVRPQAELEYWLRESEGAAPTLPVAFGVCCAAAAIDVRPALAGYVYTRLAATASTAMRLMSIGQHEAHALLADVLGRAPAAVEAVIERGGRPAVFTPALDIAAMSQQYMHSRLFKS